MLALLVVGAALGTVGGGHLGDMMLRRGNLTARLWIPASCYIGAALVLIPGLLVNSLGTAVWLFVAAGVLISAAGAVVEHDRRAPGDLPDHAGTLVAAGSPVVRLPHVCLRCRHRRRVSAAGVSPR